MNLSPEILKRLTDLLIVEPFDEATYGEFEQYLARQLDQVVADESLTPGFNYFQAINERGMLIPSIVLAEKINSAREDTVPTGMIQILPVPNFSPDPFEAVFTTRTYVSPASRGRGLSKQLIAEAELVFQENTQQADRPSFLVVENLLMPEDPAYTGIRQGIADFLLQTGYVCLDPEAPSPHSFAKVIEPVDPY